MWSYRVSVLKFLNRLIKMHYRTSLRFFIIRHVLLRYEVQEDLIIHFVLFFCFIHVRIEKGLIELLVGFSVSETDKGFNIESGIAILIFAYKLTVACEKLC